METRETLMTETAKQVTRVGSFELPCGADTAFPLFSPEGERVWVKGWDPRPVFPETVEFRSDTVFRTGEGTEDAVWTIVRADWQEHRAEYVRVAPESHTAHIAVKIEPVERERSHITVSYTVTAFGSDREKFLDAFSATSFADRMVNWKRQIGEYVERQKS